MSVAAGPCRSWTNSSKQVFRRGGLLQHVCERLDRGLPLWRGRRGRRRRRVLPVFRRQPTRRWPRRDGRCRPSTGDRRMSGGETGPGENRPGSGRAIRLVRHAADPRSQAAAGLSWQCSGFRVELAQSSLASTRIVQKWPKVAKNAAVENFLTGWHGPVVLFLCFQAICLMKPTVSEFSTRQNRPGSFGCWSHLLGACASDIAVVRIRLLRGRDPPVLA